MANDTKTNAFRCKGARARKSRCVPNAFVVSKGWLNRPASVPDDANAFVCALLAYDSAPSTISAARLPPRRCPQHHLHHLVLTPFFPQPP